MGLIQETEKNEFNNTIEIIYKLRCDRCSNWLSAGRWHVKQDLIIYAENLGWYNDIEGSYPNQWLCPGCTEQYMLGTPH